MAFIHNLQAYLSPLIHLAPYHLLSYGVLLGTTVYQSFVNTKVCYQVLPVSAFTTLQKRIFPVYFQMQTALLIVTVLTVPPYGPVSFIQEKRNWVPLVFASGMALLNLLIYGPLTQTAMMERVHQATRERTKPERKGTKSEPSNAMQTKNRQFSRAHAMSIHLNLLCMIATVWYGTRLASRINLEA